MYLITTMPDPPPLPEVLGEGEPAPPDPPAPEFAAPAVPIPVLLFGWTPYGGDHLAPPP